MLVTCLAAKPIWAEFGRHVVTNLTTQSTSVRGFTTLLLGRYFAAELVDKGMANREEALDVFLCMEQLSCIRPSLPLSSSEKAVQEVGDIDSPLA